MAKNREPVTCKTAREFITETAEDCIARLKEKDREYLIGHPYALDYHFTYCLYIRNHYIHNRDFSEVDFFAEPDHLSGEIIRMIFAKLIEDYDYDDDWITRLYDDTVFLQLRREYKGIYGEYPAAMVKEYQARCAAEPKEPAPEPPALGDKEPDGDAIMKRLESYHKACEKYDQWIDRLKEELAKKVWRIDDLKQTAEECGIDFETLLPKIEAFQKLLWEEKMFLPPEICLLPYKKAIGQERYLCCRKRLSESVKEHPKLMEKLDPAYFNDRVLARAVLKCGWLLMYLPQYQDDEKMVRYCLSHDGGAIEYASKRLQRDREWARFAIAHARCSILHLDCMKPYRKDKELVYLACQMYKWNFTYLDRAFRDDYELAKICMKQTGDPNSIYRYMSARLRDNKELAMLDLQESYPNIEHYSARLKNDDEIAAELFRLHGTDTFMWHYMSRRLQKKYHFETD